MDEGVGRTKSDGHSVLQALGVISFDDETAAYRIRAFNEGRFLESEVKLLDRDKAISWSFALSQITTSSEPAKIPLELTVHRVG
jgi:hypothetical protein